MKIETLVDDYLDYLKMERGLSKNSISSYRRDLIEFASSQLFKKMKKVSPAVANDYIAFLNHRGRKPTTIARKISSLKGFCAYLVDRGMLKENPFATLSAPKISRYHPGYLSPAEIQQIIDGIDLTQRQGWRDRMVIELLYGSGLRISELIDLRLNDIESEAGFIRVTGKGNKQRLVPLGKFAQEAIEMYLRSDISRSEFASGNRLLLNRFRKPFSRVGLWKLVRRCVLRAGISKPVSPHTFRHSFATHMIEGGADLRIVQEMLGHADISTTQIYTRIDQDYIVAEHRKYHPRELAGSKDD
ncbi:MAG: site-specific tyrosine recombinase XerD [Candidatus Zixiibacteriota bacterium]|nr:MAG: site-specific tyrosine recombinase XerD [candidate division Zixibacteria bacterium]